MTSIKHNEVAVLIKPFSSGCNLNCRYCFYADESRHRLVPSHGLMSYETMDTVISRIAEYLDDEGTAIISFQGGEPVLAGLEYYRNFMARMKKHPGIKALYGIQTNGTLLTRRWARFFRDNGFLVGISLDGFRDNMDRFRVDRHGESVFDSVMQGLQLLKEENVPYSVLTVITRQLAYCPDQLFDFLVEQNIEQIQLIPCLPALEDSDDGMSLTGRLFADFHIRFFDRWLQYYQSGHIINVGMYENLLRLMTGQPPLQCGVIGKCAIQNVIEANGDVYPCDFYCLDEQRLGNVHEHTLAELSENKTALRFLEGEHCEKDPCKECTYRMICHGGCRRQNVCWLGHDYCGYREVLEHILPALSQLLKAR